MPVFKLPDLGEGLWEAEIREWLVKEGDKVKADQPLVSVETDKAVVEVPSPQAGKVEKIFARIGERIPVGAPLVEFASAGGPAHEEREEVDLRDAEKSNAEGLHAALQFMRSGIENRTLLPAAFQGATITLSNFGTLGAGKYAALVVVPPQTAIVGAGKVYEAVGVAEGEPKIQTRLPLSITFDHRAATGGETARFLAAMIADLEKEE